MKKPTLIAAGVLLALLAIFFVLQSSDDAAPREIGFKIPKMDNLDRIEVVQGDKKTVLARKDDAWRIVEPIDFPVADNVTKELTTLFDGPIAMDREMGKAADASRYELDANAASITLFDGGQKKVAFKLGKEITVPNTYVKRTYLQPEGSDVVYRAQAGMRSKLVLELEVLRNKKLLDFTSDLVTSVELEYDGKKVTLAREGDAWKSVEPAGESLDVAAIDRLTGAAGRLRVDGFADDIKPADAGLEAPALKATFKLKDGKSSTLLFGGVVPGKGDEPDKALGNNAPDRYLQLAGQPWIYTAKGFTISGLEKRLADLRSKDIMTLEADKVERLTFTAPGQEPVLVVRESRSWKMTAPREAIADNGIVDAAVRTLVSVKADRVPDVGVTEAGLSPEQASKLEVALNGGETRVIYIGEKVASDKTARYVRVGAEGRIFEMAGYQVDKLLALVPDTLNPPPPAEEPVEDDAN